MIWTILKKKIFTTPAQKAATLRERKVKEGIDFTIKKYGETLKDLARYDRGEPVKN